MKSPVGSVGPGESLFLRILPGDEAGVGRGGGFGAVGGFRSPRGDKQARFFRRYGKTNGFLHDASPRALRMTGFSGVSQW